MGCCGTKYSPFVEDCLSKHNELRALHGSPPLKISRELTRYSEKWARALAKSDTLKHSDSKLRSGEKLGENLYSYWSSNPTTEIDGKSVVQSWYDEIKDYNFSNGTFSSKTGTSKPGLVWERVKGPSTFSGHFTQVVWKASTELGVGYAQSAKGTWFVVANYKPAGNVLRQFTTNVLPR